MFGFEQLTSALETHLSKYEGITTNTDIFEHALLHFLDYYMIPEKCLFQDVSNDRCLSVFLSAPYNLDSSFPNHILKECAKEHVGLDFHPVSANRGNFHARLTISYSWVEQNLQKIFQSMDTLLKDPLKIEFYRY